MATTGVITVGGLATGLDTNKIIDQLLQIEHQPIDLLEQQISAAQATQTSVATVGTKLASLKSAADALSTVSSVLVRKAASSNETVLAAAAGEGAAPGSVTLTVSQLARASTASATVGVGAATATIADASGSFKFQVGSGAVQTVQVDGTTTLQDLVDAINDLGAGVTASAVNLGTSASPDYRLQLVSDHTGAASSIAIVRDDTRLAVQTTVSGQDAHFTVAGFNGTFARDTNSFSDVLAGVTISLKALGTATVTVDTDTDAVVDQVKTLVTTFNDLQTFVDGESTVQETDDKSDVTVGSLATDTTVRRLLTRLHDIFSGSLTGATTKYVNLSSLGLATQKDGTILLDETKLRAALGDDPAAAAQVFAGNGTGAGIANDLSTYVEQATGAGGTLATHTQGITDEIKSLQDEVDAGQRHLDQVEADLRTQFAALEELVSSLQSQGNFLLAALGQKSSS